MTMRYRQVTGGMLNDAKVRGFSIQALTVWTAFLVGPQTTSLPGVLTGRKEPHMLAVSDWLSEHEFDVAIAQIVGQKMAITDWKAGLIFLPNATKHCPVPSQKTIKGWSSTWRDIRDCELKWHVFHHLMRYCRANDARSKVPKARVAESAFVEACEVPAAVVSPSYFDPYRETLKAASNQPLGVFEAPSGKVFDVQEQEQEQEYRAADATLRSDGPSDLPAQIVRLGGAA